MTNVETSASTEISMTPCSYLFVPADQQRMLERAVHRGAGALIIDLEDAVAPNRKLASREHLRNWLPTLSPLEPELWVRVNGTQDMLSDDLDAVCSETITGVVVPKVSSRADLESLGSMLSLQEKAKGMDQGSLSIIPLIESAAALVDLVAIAKAPRVCRLQIGESDLGAELWVDPADSQSWHPIRMALVVASANAGLPGPIGPVVADFRNLEALEFLTTEIARLGFRAGAAIHPVQLPVIERAFTPTSEEYERAVRQIALYEEALAKGQGAIVGDDGEMIDQAIVERASRIAETGLLS